MPRAGAVLSKGRGERKLYQAEQGRRPGNTITLEGRLISVRTHLETFPPFVFKVEKTLRLRQHEKTTRKKVNPGWRYFFYFFFTFGGGGRRGGGTPKAKGGRRKISYRDHTLQNAFSCLRIQILLKNLDKIYPD